MVLSLSRPSPYPVLAYGRKFCGTMHPMNDGGHEALSYSQEAEGPTEVPTHG